jgi:hypothetical protein
VRRLVISITHTLHQWDDKFEETDMDGARRKLTNADTVLVKKRNLKEITPSDL